MTEFKTWDEYVAEAEIAPFELKISEDDTIVIKAPSGAALTQFSSAYRSGDGEAMLATLCGDQWERVREILPTGSHKALENLVYDLMLHFDMADDVELRAPDGGIRTERDPRKIKKLMKAGWKMRGE